jgi:hypothetical protein
MDFTDITQKLKSLAVNDDTLYGLIEDRFFPHAIQIEDQDQSFPLINVHLLSSNTFPEKKLYPIKSFLFDCYYISNNSVDEANAIYERFHAIINNNKYALSSGVMVVAEDTGAYDVSGVYGGQHLYIISNTWEIRKIQ